MTSSAPKSEPLRILYWRSEILRVVYWLYGEGLGDLVDIDLVRQYLGVEPDEDLSTYMNLLVADGSLVRDGEWFAPVGTGHGRGRGPAGDRVHRPDPPGPQRVQRRVLVPHLGGRGRGVRRSRRRTAPASDHEAGKAPA